MKQSGMMARMKQERQVYMSIAERITRQLMFDTLQIALHRNGWGYERIKKLSDEWQEIYDHYHGAVDRGPEEDVFREHMDRELADILKEKQPLIPFELRYPEARKITY